MGQLIEHQRKYACVQQKDKKQFAESHPTTTKRIQFAMTTDFTFAFVYSLFVNPKNF